MIIALNTGWTSVVGTPERPHADPAFEAVRAQIGHEVAAGHCRACDGFLAVEARSGTSGLTAAMVGVDPAGRIRGRPGDDRVTISAAGRSLASRGAEDASNRGRTTDELERALDTEAVDPVMQRGDDDPALAERRQLAALQARDREVRAHEQAHKAAAGPHGGAMSFDYQRGPDGRLYAIGGEIAIDLSTIAGDPQATIDKMEQIRRSALAPAEPSATDRAVAARASALAEQARAELRTERAAVEGEPLPTDATPPDGPRPPGTARRAATAAAQIEAATRSLRGVGGRIDLVI